MSLREPFILEGVRRGAGGESRGLASGEIAYRVIDGPPSSGDARRDARRPTRLRSAKIIDGANVFVCEALIRDQSAAGLRLLLARNVGLPDRFVVHDDLTGELVTVACVWRRDRMLGVRILPWASAPNLKRSLKSALGGRYYGMPD